MFEKVWSRKSPALFLDLLGHGAWKKFQTYFPEMVVQNYDLPWHNSKITLKQINFLVHCSKCRHFLMAPSSLCERNSLESVLLQFLPPCQQKISGFKESLVWGEQAIDDVPLRGVEERNPSSNVTHVFLVYIKMIYCIYIIYTHCFPYFLAKDENLGGSSSKFDF